MATPLKNVQMGWKGLQDVINRIIDTVNSQTPVEGSGINIEDSANGKIISVANQTGGGGGGDSSQTNAGAGAQDPHLLATEIDWHGVKWQDVTVVDPSTCAQSTLTVLTQTKVDTDIVVITVQYPFWVAPSQGVVTG